MSSYHSSFTYLNKNSKSDFSWNIVHFSDGADQGEKETGLATESIYTASHDGTRRNLYGTKYSGAEPVRITVVKSNGSDFSIEDNRKALKWLTGAKTDSWLDLYIGDEMKYRMHGHVQNVLQYKMDARIVALVVVFELASPWAFSSLQVVGQAVNGSASIQIDCPSDDLYTYVNTKTTYENTGGSALTIKNNTTGEITQVDNLVQNEIVILDNNMFIISDKPNKIFGNSFNFVWPRFISGINDIAIEGNGNITFEYYYPIKIGDCAIDVNERADDCYDGSCYVDEAELKAMLERVLI
jgi:hypothetical protein